MSTSRCLRRLQNKYAIATSVVASPRAHSLVAFSSTAKCIPRRQFTHTPRRFHTLPGHYAGSIQTTDDVSSSQENSELVLEDELLTIQDAAIEELEAMLGKPLQAAIEDDQLAERLLAGTAYEHSTSGEVEMTIEEAEDPLMALRTGGLPPEEIVRAARNIFGDYLPGGVLSEKEFAVYKRLYGEPLPEDDELEELPVAEAETVSPGGISENTLYSVEGEELSYQLESAAEIENSIRKQPDFENAFGIDDTYARTSARPQLTTGIEEIARTVQGDVINQELDDYEPDEEEVEPEDTRSHPLTKLGKFGTYPRTTFFSKETFIRPVEEVMSNFSNRQLKEMCERTFGGPGLPDSPLTPRSGRSRQQVPIPLEASQNVMGQMEANAFMASVMPPTYASILAVLTETRKRLGASWLNKTLAKPGGPRILDAGSGGVGILAWRDVVQAHWEALHSSNSNRPPPPESKSVVLTGSDALRHRAIRMLDNTTFIPRLPDYIQTRQIPTLDDDRPAQQRKQFDLIIAPHSLFALKEEWERKLHVKNLWSLLSDDGGVLILIEKGIPRGFETIAAAREMLLERYITTPEGQEGSLSITATDINAPESEVYQKTPGMIVAPCTNHTKCPLYRTAGVSRGRKDICSFQQRYVRPPFLQRVLGAKDRNHDDVDFSYLSVMKGEDLRTRSFSTWDQVSDPFSAPPADSAASAAEIQRSAIDEMQSGFEHVGPTSSDSTAPPPTHALPRIINQPLKRQAHVTIDLCTPTGEIRRWTIPKSFSRQAYRDARKARWGDLWALGAKTNVARNLKVGVSEKDLQGSGGKMAGSMGKPRSRKERLEMEAAKILEAEEAAEEEEQSEEQELMRLIEEDNLLDDPEDDLIDMDTLTPKSTAGSAKGKPKQNHAKLNNVNIFGKTATSKRSATEPTADPPSSKFNKKTNRVPGNSSHGHIYERYPDTIGTTDHFGDRYGEEDPLAYWSESLDDTMLEDEARRQLSKSGRRPTTKNTQRLKRELRRARRESSRI